MGVTLPIEVSGWVNGGEKMKLTKMLMHTHHLGDLDAEMWMSPEEFCNKMFHLLSSECN